MTFDKSTYYFDAKVKAKGFSKSTSDRLDGEQRANDQWLFLPKGRVSYESIMSQLRLSNVPPLVFSPFGI